MARSNRSREQAEIHTGSTLTLPSRRLPSSRGRAEQTRLADWCEMGLSKNRFGQELLGAFKAKQILTGDARDFSQGFIRQESLV
jgi:hypothetical protein